MKFLLIFIKKLEFLDTLFPISIRFVHGEFFVHRDQFNTEFIFESAELILRRPVVSLCYEGKIWKCINIYLLFNIILCYPGIDGYENKQFRIGRADGLEGFLKYTMETRSIELYPC